ncbi:MAG: hypothetical protein AABW90_01525 [Nanoarchaeota archaeon]
MKKLNGLINKLGSKLSQVILAGSLALSSPVTTKADDKTDWDNLRDWYIINEGIRTVNDSLRTYNEYQFQRWLIERDSRYFQQYDKNQDKKIDDPNQIPQTFVANYHKDFNEDGYVGITEHVGLNKKVFRTDEILIYGMYMPTKGIKGKKYELKLFNKNGNLVHNYNGKFKRDREYSERPQWTSKNLSEIVEKHGEGTYAVAFYLNGSHWNTREFELINVNNNQKGSKKFPETFIGHWCQEDDLDKDNLADYDEFKKLGEKKFKEGERISFGIMPARKGAKELFEVRVFSKDSDRLAYSQKVANETPGGTIFHNNSLNSGKYYTVFKRDDKYVNDIEFEVILNPEKRIPAPAPAPAHSLAPAHFPRSLDDDNPAPVPAPAPEPTRKLSDISLEDFQFYNFRYWDDKDKDGLIDQNIRELIG